MSGGMPELVPVLDRHRFDEAALARHLREHLPGFDGPVEVRQFQGGQSNPTFHIRTGAGEYVLRKKPPGKLLPRAHAVEREYRIIRALEGSDVPVPRARLLEEDASVIGTAFFIMDHVPGRVFFDRVMTAGAPAERAAVYEDMARVLAALHRVDWRAAGLEGFGKPEGYMARQVALWTQQWEAARVEEMPEMDRLAAWLPGHVPKDEEATIAHGDFRLGNLIIHQPGEFEHGCHPGAVVVGARRASAVVVGAHNQRLGARGGGDGRLHHRFESADLPARRGEGLPEHRVAHPLQGGLDVRRGTLELLGVPQVVGPARVRPHVVLQPPGELDLFGRQRRQRARAGTPRHRGRPEHPRHQQRD